MNKFKFSCPNCDQHIEASWEHVGVHAVCPTCRNPLVVPAPELPQDAARAVSADRALDSMTENASGSESQVQRVNLLETLLGNFRKKFAKSARRSVSPQEQSPTGFMTIERGLEIIDNLSNALVAGVYVNGSLFMRLSTIGATSRMELAKAFYICMACNFKQTHQYAPSTAEIKRLHDFVDMLGGTMCRALFSTFLPDKELDLLASLKKGTLEYSSEDLRLAKKLHDDLESRGSDLGRLETINGFVEFLKTLDVSACHYWPRVFHHIGLPYPDANALFRLAAEQGHADAQFTLGLAYAGEGEAHANIGEAVLPDEAESVRWYRMAAEQGFVLAMCNLGNAYRFGKGVAKDDSEAVKWYRKAAEQGDGRAQMNLACCYSNGWGVAGDFAESVKWYRKAAEQGISGAQIELSCAYATGYGVGKDLVEAYRWLYMAASQGDTHALKPLSTIEALLSPSQISQAKEMAGGIGTPKTPGL